MKRVIYFYSLMLLILGLTSCQTTQLSQYKQVRVGMEKFEVLELMGSPQRNIRSDSLDKWTYIFYDEGRKFQREVHFKNGKAIYVGEPTQPKVSAEQIDAANERSNKNLQQGYDRQQMQTVPTFKGPASESGSAPIKIPVDEIMSPPSSRTPTPIYTEIR